MQMFFKNLRNLKIANFIFVYNNQTLIIFYDYLSRVVADNTWSLGSHDPIRICGTSPSPRHHRTTNGGNTVLTDIIFLTSSRRLRGRDMIVVEIFHIPVYCIRVSTEMI